MKTGTLRTLGAAALGAAFAAAAAGSASAAPVIAAASPAKALDTVSKQLPVGKVTGLVPGTSQATDTVKGTLRGAPQSLGSTGAQGLLGGVPVGAKLPVG